MCAVLHNGLVKSIKSNNLNSKFQIGFSENCRTSDHILSLKTLVNKTINDGKNLYTCFIDFKIAFDSVWRNGLFHKLLKANIGGPFGKIIRDIYANTSLQIKLDNGLTNVTNAFTDNIGVKQGCVLSPTLFKLFVNDLPDIFYRGLWPCTVI